MNARLAFLRSLYAFWRAALVGYCLGFGLGGGNLRLAIKDMGFFGCNPSLLP